MKIINEEIDSVTKQIAKVGYYISYFAVVIILLWIGIFKFTPTEANAIQPLVANHPFMSWLYDCFSVQIVSMIIGSVEIITALLLILGLRCKMLRIAGGLFVIITFLITLSFLVTTPGVWKMVDGVLITEFSLLKDLAMLGIGGIIMRGLDKK